MKLYEAVKDRHEFIEISRMTGPDMRMYSSTTQPCDSSNRNHDKSELPEKRLFAVPVRRYGKKVYPETWA